jgi:hypothetical protein
LNGLSDANDVR